MKLLSLAGRRMSLLAGAWLLLTGAYSAYAQTSITNFQVTITAPTNDSSFSAPTNIQIDALVFDTADDVAEVTFTAALGPPGTMPPILFLGTVSNGVPVGPPGSHQELFSFTWSNALVGTWRVEAEALRSNGVETISPPVMITVQSQSNSFFSVDITSPTNGAVFSAPTNIQIDALTFDATDDVAEVTFTAGLGPPGFLPPILLLGTVSNGVPVGPPGSHQELFSFTWSNALAGTWELEAEAIGSNGQETASKPVIITVQPGPVLTVDIASPTNGAIFDAPTNIELIAGVSDADGAFVDVQFFDGTNSLGVASNWAVVDPPGSPGLPPGSRAYFLTWSNAPYGIHVLTAIAMDTNGESAVSAPVKILIGSNFPPEVRITSPPNNSVFRAPVNIALLAYANVPFGYVSSVQFFAGSNSLGFGVPISWPVPRPWLPITPEPIGPPIILTNNFELIWSNAPPGSYALTAIATGNTGLTATSAPVNISVLPLPPPPTNGPDLVRIVATDPIAIAGTNCWPWLGLGLPQPAWSNWVSPNAPWRWFTNCGPKDAIFTLCREGETNDDLTITYSIGGTASNGVDYVALPGVATIPAGQAQTMIAIIPMNDDTNDATETVILRLNPSTNSVPDYLLGRPRHAEALIVDREFPHPWLTGEILGDHSFFLSAGGPDGAWFRVDYSTDGLTWTPVCTNQVVGGSIDFADPDAANSPVRLYRAVPLSNAPSD